MTGKQNLFPKFDDAASYILKLSENFENAKPKRVSILRMEVPCCGGLVLIVKHVFTNSRVDIPFENITIGIEGRIINREVVRSG